MPSQASPKPNGRELRRARNVVKKWERDWSNVIDPHSVEQWQIRTEIAAKRYERACAMILADKLRNS